MKRQPLTLDALKKIYIRVQSPDGTMATVDVFNATDSQFDTWIRTLVYVQDDCWGNLWVLEDRLKVCNILYLEHKVHMATDRDLLSIGDLGKITVDDIWTAENAPDIIFAMWINSKVKEIFGDKTLINVPSYDKPIRVGLCNILWCIEELEFSE